MKPFNRILTISVLGMGVALMFGMSFCGQPNSTGRIVPVRSFTSWIPHMADNNKLVVDGRKFEMVQGAYPFFIAIKELNAIVFVCRNRNYSSKIHYYDLNTRIEKSIDVDSSGVAFERHIGLNDGVILVTPIKPFCVDIVTKSNSDRSDFSRFVSQLDFNVGVYKEIAVRKGD